MTLSQLLDRCKQDDAAAQQAVYSHYATPMFLLCRRYVKTDVAAEEAMLSGFLKFYQSLNSFRYISDEATTGWLRRIMVTECLMLLRRRESFLHLLPDVEVEIAEEDGVLEHLSAAEIFSLITQLPTGYRTVFNLFAIEGYSHREIAEALHISEATSRSQLHKAKSLLQQLLVKHNPDYAWRKTK